VSDKSYRLQDSGRAAPFAFLLGGVFDIGSEAVKAAPIAALVPALTGFGQCSSKFKEGEGSFPLSDTFSLPGLSARSSSEFYTLSWSYAWPAQAGARIVSNVTRQVKVQGKSQLEPNPARKVHRAETLLLSL